MRGRGGEPLRRLVAHAFERGDFRLLVGVLLPLEGPREPGQLRLAHGEPALHGVQHLAPRARDHSAGHPLDRAKRLE